MGSCQLMSEEIEAGAEFLDCFDKSLGVKAAYWLKLDDDSQPRFYVALEEGGSEYFSPEQRLKVIETLQNMRNPHLDPFQLRLVGLENPITRGVIEYQDYYVGRLPIHYVDTVFAGRIVDEIYIYPPPAPVPVA